MNRIKTHVPRADQIDHIMYYFDFAKVEETMAKLNWTWWDTAPMVPTIEQLKKEARYCLEQLNENIIGHGSGGFIATVDRYGHLFLAFQITEWDAGEFCNHIDDQS